MSDQKRPSNGGRRIHVNDGMNVNPPAPTNIRPSVAPKAPPPPPKKK